MRRVAARELGGADPMRSMGKYRHSEQDISIRRPVVAAGRGIGPGNANDCPYSVNGCLMVHRPAHFTRYLLVLLYARKLFAPVEAAESPRRHAG